MSEHYLSILDEEEDCTSTVVDEEDWPELALCLMCDARGNRSEVSPYRPTNPFTVNVHMPGETAQPGSTTPSVLSYPKKDARAQNTGSLPGDEIFPPLLDNGFCVPVSPKDLDRRKGAQSRLANTLQFLRAVFRAKPCRTAKSQHPQQCFETA